MKQLKNIIALCLISMLAFACEKEIAEEPKTEEQPPEERVIDNGVKSQAMSVAEAIGQDDGTQVCIKGYIVASTQRSMSNCDFEAPFSGSSAIVMADIPVSEGGDDEDAEADLLPVCLTDCSKSIRTALNLENNPQLWNHLIYIYGTRSQYMSTEGLKKVTAYEVAQ